MITRTADLAIITAINDNLERMMHTDIAVESVLRHRDGVEAENPINTLHTEDRARWGRNTTPTPPPDLPMLDVVDTTGEYTEAQRSGDEPVFAATVYGTGLTIRLTVDVVEEETQRRAYPSCHVDGYGRLDRDAVHAMVGAFGRWTAAAIRAFAWQETTP